MHVASQLIVNADDFGLGTTVNEGIIACFERGIVTSTSLMVRQPGASEAAEYARSSPGLGVGLHLDLGEWALRNGNWVPLYEVAPLDSAQELADEIHRQIAAFHDLLGREPTHLDSHQHVHQREPLRSILRAVAAERCLPLRHENPGVRYCGNFYGQCEDGSALHSAISPGHLVETIAGLSSGITELACHPAAGPVENTMYDSERLMELRTLCDPAVREAIRDNGIVLIRFTEVGGSHCTGESS